jgi:AraC-like DNA-binding protein
VRAGRWPEAGRALTDIAILIVTLAASVGLYRIRSADLFAAPRAAGGPVKEAPSPPSESPLIACLRHLMDHDRAYRSEGFGIAALAAQLGEPEYRLRRAINGELGFRNFTAFLNSYRLAEVKAALADAGQRDVPILIIAIDAGFGSLGPFNRAFREAEGMTPSEFRRTALGAPLADFGID